MARYLAPQWPRLTALAAFMIVQTLAQLVGPQIISRFLNIARTAALGSRDERAALAARSFIDAARVAALRHGDGSLVALWGLAGAFIVAAIATQLMQIGATYFSEQVAWGATNRMRGDLAAHALHLDMSYHTATSPGDTIERVDGDVAALANFFSQFVLQIIGGALLLAGIVVVVMFMDWRVGMTLVGMALVTGFIMFAMRNVARARWERVRDAFSAFSAFLEERLAGLDDIRANAGGVHAMRRFKGLTDELAISNMAGTRRGQWIYFAAFGLFALGFALALAVATQRYLQHAIPIGQVYAFIMYAGMMAQPVVIIGTQLQQFQMAGASLSRIRTLLAVTAELEDGPGVGWRGLGQAAPRVCFEHVNFAYRADAPVLRDVDLTLEPGQVLGLLGRTGSGKTTLTRLLFRLYDPLDGRITLDGEDIREATLAELRGRIGLVTQEVQLFDASIRDNATLFDPQVPDARIVEVLTDLGLGDWLARQPQGLGTVLAAGSGLSAGEAQLLAFARVFLKDPGLVVLDEASSRLDPVSDRLIERALDKLLGGGAGAPKRTAIIIAHKLSTVDRADRIAILDGGRVLETGGRAALAANPASAFARLLATGAEEALA